MPVIAMTQEMGSLAKDVALQLGQSHQLAVMRHEVIDHVAEKMQMQQSVIHRLREGKAGLVERIRADQRSMAVYTAEEVFDLASRGDVVLRGWGATCLLRPVAHVVRVRITRSLENRVAWLMQHLQTDDTAFAAEEIRRSDAAHASRMQHQFGVDWGDPVLYDLVLNTDRVSVESCAAQIMTLAARPEFQESADSRATLADLALAARIRASLRADEATRELNIAIEPQGPVVSLRGIVLDEGERALAEKAVRAVAGVGEVDNQLRLMTSPHQFTDSKYS